MVVNGNVLYLLNLSLPPERMASLLAQSLEPGRRAGIVDRNDRVVARTEDLPRVIGNTAAPDFVRATRAREGIWRGTNVAGETVRSAFTHSKLTGWTVYVSLPEAVIMGALQETMLTLVALGVALIVLAMLIAYWVGGRLAGRWGRSPNRLLRSAVASRSSRAGWRSPRWAPSAAN